MNRKSVTPAKSNYKKANSKKVNSKKSNSTKTQVKSKNTKNNSKKNKTIYLDNNSTTKLCQDSKKAIIDWLDNCGNPSSSSSSSSSAKKMIDSATEYILNHCGVSGKTYTCLFTSGASESNSYILKSVVDAYKLNTGNKPHIITSSTEHKSIIQCCNLMSEHGLLDITYIEPNAYGYIDPELIKKSIKPTTALISVMFANNEIGCINNIRKIGEIAHDESIPLHTDAVQLFGKYKLNLMATHIDAISLSFHKLHGPLGMGAIIINNKLIEGYGLKFQIAGPQQSNLRGGTENTPGIAGAVSAIKHTFKDRQKKNKHLMALRTYIISGIKKKLPMGDYKSYFSKPLPTRNEFIILGADFNGDHLNSNILPHTILISFIKNKEFDKYKGKTIVPFCNDILKKKLEQSNIIVSIGSACNTSDAKASHVLYSIKAPELVRAGTIRISLSDDTTKCDIDKFIIAILKHVAEQMPF